MGSNYVPGMMDPEYARMSGPGRLVAYDRLSPVKVDGRTVYRWRRRLAVAVDIGRAPAPSAAGPADMPQSDILAARSVRAAGIAMLAGEGGRDGVRIWDFQKSDACTVRQATSVKRIVQRDPVFVQDRHWITLAPDWRDHADRDVPDPDPVRWTFDAVIRWYRDHGNRPATAQQIADYSGMKRKSVSSMISRISEMFHHVDVVDNAARRKLTRSARALLLPALLAALVGLGALLLPAQVTAQQTAPGYSAPRPTPTAQTSRYRRYDTGGRSSSTPRCRWIPSLGRYQCDPTDGSSGSRYGSHRSDTVPGTDRRAPGVPTPRPTPAN